MSKKASIGDLSADGGPAFKRRMLEMESSSAKDQNRNRIERDKQKRAFFSNKGKKEQERWVLDKWLERKIPAVSFSNVTYGETPDFTLNKGMEEERFIEITEVLQEGRKRGDEYREDSAHAKAGLPYKVRNVELDNIDDNGVEWITKAMEDKIKKYSGKQDIATWILVVYANFWIFETFDWEKLMMQIAGLNPGFRAIDILYSQGGLQVRTVFENNQSGMRVPAA
jgi:hypothetical protein